MKKTVIVILSLSICLASRKLQKQMDKLMKSLQDQYQIYTPEDLHKLRSQPSAADRTNSNRDMSDIVGEWYLDHTNIGLYVTVGTDQSIPNGAALMALDTAEGSITATHNDWETELNYLLDGSFLEGEDDDDDPIDDNDNDYYRNADALTYAQDYVDENSSDYDQSTFDLETEFDLVIDGNDVSGGLGGDDPENCEINWPEDPFRMAVYSFVSEYVLEEGGSVGCFVDSDTLDQTYEDFVLDMESGWTGDDDYTVCAGMSSEDPDWVCCDCNCMDFDDMECMADDEDCLENLECGDDEDDGYSYGPRIAAYLTDLDPTLGGHIYFDDTDTEATITFLDVPLIVDESALNTFQMQLVYETDEVIFSYKDLSLSGESTFDASGGLAIGIANGGGNYDDVDLSESSGQSYSNPVEGYSDDNELDLDYKKITFTPNDDHSEYSIMVETITDLEGSYSNEITVEDDDYTLQSLSSNFKFYGQSWNEIYINNDGNIGFEDGDETCVCWICDDGDGECAAEYLAGGGDDGDDNESSQLFIMNFDFMNFFAFIFGMDLEGVDNPLLVVFDHEEDMVLAMTPPPAFGEESPVYFAGGPDEVVSSVSIDTVEQTVTFTELSLMDSTGAVVFVLDGTIGPGMIDLVADVETELPFPAIFNEQDQEEIYMTFYEDSTGIEVQIYEDYYYEETADTSDFYWYATSDSLYTINEDDYYYYEGDWDGGMYEFSGDTMVLSGEDHPCDDYYYGSMDDCMEEIAEELPMVAGLEDVDEFYAYLESILMPVSMVSISPDAGTLPEKFALYPAYPNPFNPVTTLRYDLPEGALVNITIYDMMGRQVKSLMKDQQTAGHRSLQWNATNNAGSPVSAGIYLYMIRAGDFRQTRKMVLLK